MRPAYLALPLLLAIAAPAVAQTRPHFTNPPALPKPRGYSHMVEVPPGQRLLYLSGQVALDSTGALIGGKDFRAQARQVFENLRRGLTAAGASFADVVKLNFYLLDASQVPALREVRDKYINPSAPPASTLVEVRRLFRDDLLLEVEAIAAVPASGARTVEHFPVTADRTLPFAEAVRVGDMLYLSGQLGTDSAGRLVPGGIGPETRQALNNIAGVLARHGSALDRVVKCTVMLADIGEWAAMNQVYLTFFRGHRPARSAFGATGLALGARLELECMATVGAGS